MKTYQIKLILVSFIVFVLANTAVDNQDDVEYTQETQKQLQDYNNHHITKWLIQNQANFEQIIKETATETRTKWAVEDREVKFLEKGYVQHMVIKNETIFSISKKYGVSVEDIMKWNNLVSHNIFLGKLLKIYTNNDLSIVTEVERDPTTHQESTKQEVIPKVEEDNMIIEMPEFKYYKIKKGDTFFSVARNHNITPKEIQELNDLDEKAVLSPGQIIKLKTPDSQPNREMLDRNLIPNFVWPVVGRILIPFGTQKSGEENEGINISARKGMPIKAAEDGIVTYVGNELKSFGNIILIQHNKEWVTAYAHVDDMIVNKGQIIKKGEIIAKIGTTGDIKTPQLHFELRRNIKAVNPLQFLDSHR